MSSPVFELNRLLAQECQLLELKEFGEGRGRRTDLAFAAR